MVFFEFIACSFLIFISAHYVSKEGLAIARKMNWHEGFIGVLFLAAATSLPEVFTSVSSILIGNVNLGFGDAIGSLIINIMIIGLLDYHQGRGRILLHARKENILTASFTLFLLIILSIFTYFRMHGLFGFYFLGIGIESFIIIILYLIGMHRIFHHSKNVEIEKVEVKEKFIWIKFLIFFIIIIALGIWLANIGKRISENTFFNHSFVGTLFLALATSLPELAVSLSALRMGSIDMAISNILGSNFFDVCIIPFMDVAVRSNSVLKILNPISIFTLLIAAIMTVIVIIGLSIRSKDTKLKLSWDAALILIVGIAGYYVIYRLG